MKFIKNIYKHIFIGSSIAGSRIANKMQLFELRADYLRNQTLQSSNMGITSTQYFDNEVIVSLTTYGKRLYEVYLTIESIMQGTLLPNRIILWLEDTLKESDIPLTLLKQKARGLEICFCKDLKSYKKLIPTLSKYPNAIYITIDDDVLYNYDLVENLVKAYKKNPNNVYATRVHYIKMNRNFKPEQYAKWAMCKGKEYADVFNFPTGVGGVLYPPMSLSQEVLNEESFMKLAPFGDDIWFFAMAKLNGFDSCKIFTHSSDSEDYLTNESVQDCSLNRKNLFLNRNDGQVRAVFEAYGICDLMKKRVE